MLKVSFVIYFILVNLLVYSMMAYDKRQAKKQRWRIPEKRLLFFGLLGGGLGGLLGRKQFHHKTHKARFFLLLHYRNRFDGPHSFLSDLL